MFETLLLVVMIGGAPWPDFRAHGGVWLGSLPVSWSENKNIHWKTAIHGKGWSSPVVGDEQIWLTTANEDGKQLFAVSLDRETGQILHDVKVFDVSEPAFCHAANSHASCTPVIDDNRVYVHFGSAGTTCLDTRTARLLWQRRDLPCNHYRAAGSSPIIFENLLIIPFDGVDVQYVVALDKHTGATVWKRDRDIDFGGVDGDYKKAYGTPLVIQTAENPLLITPAAKCTMAFDPRSGKEIWRVRHGGMNASARPTFTHGLVILTTGDGGDQLLAVRPDGKGDVTATHVAWRYNRHVSKRATPIVVDDLLFMGADDGFLTCLEAKTGALVWSERIGDTYWASPIAAGGRVYFFGQDGNMPVIAADRKFQLVSRNQLDAGCNATPAVLENDLIIRTKTHLYRVGSYKK